VTRLALSIRDAWRVKGATGLRSRDRARVLVMGALLPLLAHAAATRVRRVRATAIGVCVVVVACVPLFVSAQARSFDGARGEGTGSVQSSTLIAAWRRADDSAPGTQPPTAIPQTKFASG